jgi:hypothetical protein
MLEHDDLELRSWLAALDADPRVDWVDAQRDRLAASWESRTITEPLPAAVAFGTISERIGSRSTRSRRQWRLRIAVVATAVLAIVVLVVVVTLPGGDRRSVQTPLRPVPTRIPDASKTHALAVTPSTGLRDRQVVRVSVRFRGHHDDVAVSICRAGVTPATLFADCELSTAQSGGQLLNRYPYMVRRTISLGLGERTVDCAVAPGCVLYAGRSGSEHTYAVAPIVFDPLVPALPGPTVTVTPPGELRDGDTVTIHGRLFRPFDSVDFDVCVNGTDLCDDLDVGSTRAGSDGSFSVTRTVWSVFSSADGALHDCRAVTCAVGAQSSRTVPPQASSPNIYVPVSFAPAGTASYPTLTLDPAGPYTDGQQVTVTVQGWPGSIGNRPGLAIESLVVVQCGTVDRLTLCARPTGQLIVDSGGVGTETQLRGPEPDGRYTATLPLHRTLLSPGSPGIGPFDCSQPGNCQVALAVELNGEPPVHFTAILAIDVVVT